MVPLLALSAPSIFRPSLRGGMALFLCGMSIVGAGLEKLAGGAQQALFYRKITFLTGILKFPPSFARFFSLILL